MKYIKIIKNGLQKSNEKIVTSKFFESNTKLMETDEVVAENTDPTEKPKPQLYESVPGEENLETMVVDTDVSPKVHQKLLDIFSSSLKIWQMLHISNFYLKQRYFVL